MNLFMGSGIGCVKSHHSLFTLCFDLVFPSYQCIVKLFVE